MMSWWKIPKCDSDIFKEVKKCKHMVCDTVDGVLDEIEHWLGKDANQHVIITHEIPVIKKEDQVKTSVAESKPIQTNEQAKQKQLNTQPTSTQHVDQLTHKSRHCPQILKTADPFVEGGLINTELLIEDLMHNLPGNVPRNDHTKRALLAIIIKHLQNRHTSPAKGKHNWVSFAKGLDDKEFHNKELERDIVESIMKMYGSEEHLLHQNRPVLNPEEVAVKNRKYWHEQVISHVLHGMEEVDRIQIGSI